jgi:hypothetical protein
MTIEEGKRLVGQLVMTTSAGRKLVKSMKQHGPYELLQVTKEGRCILKGLGDEHRPSLSEISLYTQNENSL